MPNVSLVPADALDPAALHAAFTAAFADYLLGPFQVPFEQWPLFLARQAVDLAQSRAAMADRTVVAFCLAAPRHDRPSWRLGTMGALPAARGSGAAAALLQDFVERARAADQRDVELECFVQNERAVRLYERFGFVGMHELFGYAGRPGNNAGAVPQPTALPQPAEVVDTEVEEAFAAIEALARRDGALPLQVTPQCLRALPVQFRAWRSGEAWLVATEVGTDKINTHALIDTSADQTHAEALVRHLAALHPQRTLHVPQLQRDDLGGAALQRIGLPRLPLHQRLMRLRLA